MTEARRALGRRAEQAVVDHYARAGFEIVARNWSCRGGEVDVIARRGPLLVFVEVRARSTAFLASPTASVTAAKQRRVATAAGRFLATGGRPDVDLRFDVVGVRPHGRRFDLDVVENAFVPPWAF